MRECDVIELNKNKKSIHINGGIHFKPREKMRYDLKILPNGLIVCDVKVINPFSLDEQVECTALIDTGAEGSIICTSIFNKFQKVDLTKRIESGISTLNRESEGYLYPFKVRIPINSWGEYCTYLGVQDLTHREEYKMIIGVDILKNFDFIYSGEQRLAWLNI